MKCKKCGKKYSDKYIEEHHILPWSLGYNNNETLFLCKWCHRINQNSIHHCLNILGLTQKKKIKEFTKSWLEGKNKFMKDELPLCPYCKDINQRLFILQVKQNTAILMCARCGYKKESYEAGQNYYRKLKQEALKENRKLFIKKNLEGNKKIENESVQEY